MENLIKNPVLLIISFLLLIYLTPVTLYNLTTDVVKIKVTDKERIVTGSKDNVRSKYLVFTENEVFENTDALFYFKFNSSDIQNQLKIGKTYKVKVVGWRIPIFSVYRNIIEIIEENEE